jgi:hypothetical protein
MEVSAARTVEANAKMPPNATIETIAFITPAHEMLGSRNCDMVAFTGDYRFQKNPNAPISFP